MGREVNASVTKVLRAGPATANSLMAKVIGLSVENVRNGKGGPFAALVAKRGTVLGVGTNLVTSTNDPTAHAEIVAIREACRMLKHFQLTECEVYTTCEPCPMCMGALYWARPQKIFYAATRRDAAKIGFDDAFIYEQLRLPIGMRDIPMQQVMRQEALEAFRHWQGKPDKVAY
jgi:guanine deaminase